MIKMYELYLEKKKESKEKVYLFKSGIFYIFIADDAINISKIMPLKITKLTSNIVKCGFPISQLDRYKEIFDNLKLNIEIVEDVIKNVSSEEIINKIRSIDINKITPIKALNVLEDLKDMVNG